MEFVIDSLGVLIVAGVTVGIVIGITGAFVKVSWRLAKYVVLLAFIIYIIKTWV
jgi:hypothetical protein|tara:strand:- start:481 stop:642 length:162 start_codon:yes stop_codon:yes gene_type:complete